MLVITRGIYIYIHKQPTFMGICYGICFYCWLESHHYGTFFCGCFCCGKNSQHFFVGEIYCDEDFYTIIMISTTKNPMFPLSWNVYDIYLVGGFNLPLWKMMEWVIVGMMTWPQYDGKIIIHSMVPVTTNQISFAIVPRFKALKAAP